MELDPDQQKAEKGKLTTADAIDAAEEQCEPRIRLKFRRARFGEFGCWFVGLRR